MLITKCNSKYRLNHAVETNSELPEFRITALIAVRDRYGQKLSAGMASASSRRPLCGVFGLMLFPQESLSFAHPNWLESNVCYILLRIVNAILAKEIHVDACGMKSLG